MEAAWNLSAEWTAEDDRERWISGHGYWTCCTWYVIYFTTAIHWGCASSILQLAYGSVAGLSGYLKDQVMAGCNGIQWLKCHKMWGNTVPPPPFFGWRHSLASNCNLKSDKISSFTVLDRQPLWLLWAMTTSGVPDMKVQFPHIPSFTLLLCITVYVVTNILRVEWGILPLMPALHCQYQALAPYVTCKLEWQRHMWTTCLRSEQENRIAPVEQQLWLWFQALTIMSTCRIFGTMRVSSGKILWVLMFCIGSFSSLQQDVENVRIYIFFVTFSGFTVAIFSEN